MIKIKSWSTYQSYKDRRPPWIRFHRTMLDNFQFQSMTADSRALLPMLWLLACEDKDPTSGLVQLNLEEISFRLRLPVKTISKCINELQATEFIECIESVTNELRDGNQSVPTETETKKRQRQRQGSVPYQEILNKYHENLPNLARVNILTEKRKKKIKALFDFKPSHSEMDWWSNYFLHVNKSNFLLGENNRGWKADLEWLMNIDNFAKIVDGKYHE